MAPKRIAVLTSGGDAPGMNSAIRAVVRTGIEAGCSVLGVRRGFGGLLQGETQELSARDVSGQLQSGGTMLGTSRSREFATDDGQAKAIANLERMGVDALVVIGGNGSQRGAFHLAQRGFPVVGVASTIDNDLRGSDVSLGVDTATNIALQAVDYLKTTASSHTRAFLVEVMGRDCGYLALITAIAGGAEAVVIPEVETRPEQLARVIEDAYERGKAHAIVVVAEGAPLNAARLVEYFHANQARLGFDLRLTTLGHVQRGGPPTAFDRLLGARLGYAAVQHLVSGSQGHLVGVLGGQISLTPLQEAAAGPKPLDRSMLEMARVLSI